MARGTKQLIERKALELFVEKGIRETTVRDIAAAVGVAEGTLYRHYKSKEALADALFTKNYESLAAQLESQAQEAQSCRQALDRMISFACHAFDENWVLFSYLLLSQHRFLKERPADLPSPINVLEAVIKDGIQREEIPRQDAAQSAAMVLGLVLQTAVSVVYSRLPGPLAPHGQALKDAAWRVVAHQ